MYKVRQIVFETFDSILIVRKSVVSAFVGVGWFLSSSSLSLVADGLPESGVIEKQ